MNTMSAQSLAHAAAQNNAEWCHAFCHTHGIVGDRHVAFWSSPVRTPALYPDAVTLRPEISVERLLMGIDTNDGCSVKDCFASLDLGADGFRPCSGPSGWSRSRGSLPVRSGVVAHNQ